MMNNNGKQLFLLGFLLNLAVYSMAVRKQTTLALETMSSAPEWTL